VRNLVEFSCSELLACELRSVAPRKLEAWITLRTLVQRQTSPEKRGLVESGHSRMTRLDLFCLLVVGEVRVMRARSRPMVLTFSPREFDGFRAGAKRKRTSIPLSALSLPRPDCSRATTQETISKLTFSKSMRKRLITTKTKRSRQEVRSSSLLLWLPG
jgi:hypothetical protein